MIDTFKFEQKRLEKKGVTNPLMRLAQNRVILWSLVHVAYLTAVYMYFGQRTFFWHLLYAALVNVNVDMINYIEHYGLERQRINADKPIEEPIWEPLGRKHSWDSNASVSNYVLLKLQRHSDHHLFVYKPYHILETSLDSPQLQFGYSGTMLVALCPPVW